MNENTCEQLMVQIMSLYDKHNGELSMIECLSMLLEENTYLTEIDIVNMLDENSKLILKENSAKHNHFRKQFHEKRKLVLDI